MSAIYHWFWYLIPANPIFVRVVQGGSMRMRHYWVRFGYLGLLILLVLLGLMSGAGLSGQQVSMTELAKSGARVFQYVAYGQVALICLIAPLFMAGAIDEEHSGETFDILLTTPLTNLQVVMGSLIGRLFFVLSLLASGLPLFAIVLIFGGVPMKSVFVAFAVAALAAILVGAVAITLAVLRKGGRKAVYVFMIAIAAYLIISYGLDQGIRMWRANVKPNVTQSNTGVVSTTAAANAKQTTIITAIHPLLVLEASINTANYRPPAAEDVIGYPAPIRFYLSNPLGAFASLTGIISLSLILWSAIRIRSVGAGEGRFMIWLRDKLHLPSAGTEKRRPPRRVWANPVAWREANARGRGLWAVLSRWAFAVIGINIGIILVAAYHFKALPNIGTSPEWVFQKVLLIILLVELAAIVLVAIYMSAGSVSREREDGTLDLMLTTPITPKKYIWGKLRGLISFLSLMLAAPIGTAAIVSAYTVFTMITNTQARVGAAIPGGTTSNALFLPELVILLPITLIPFVAVCATVGMSWSIKAKGVMGAVIPSIAILGIVSLIMGLCGYNAAEHISVLGSFVNAFSPTTSLMAMLDPWNRLADFKNSTSGAGRVTLLMSTCVAAGGYGLVVFMLVQSMIRNFDQTVRKLSGTG